jgi:hypothetical protein
MLAHYEFWVRKLLTPHFRQTRLRYDTFRAATSFHHEPREDNFYTVYLVLLSVLFVKLHTNIRLETMRRHKSLALTFPLQPPANF